MRKSEICVYNFFYFDDGNSSAIVYFYVNRAYMSHFKNSVLNLHRFYHLFNGCTFWPSSY